MGLNPIHVTRYSVFAHLFSRVRVNDGRGRVRERVATRASLTRELSLGAERIGLLSELRAEPVLNKSREWKGDSISNKSTQRTGRF